MFCFILLQYLFYFIAHETTAIIIIITIIKPMIKLLFIFSRGAIEIVTWWWWWWWWWYIIVVREWQTACRRDMSTTQFFTWFRSLNHRSRDHASIVLYRATESHNDNTSGTQVVAFGLSLIHIWRCRRIERCRSRWSPYH